MKPILLLSVAIFRYLIGAAAAHLDDVDGTRALNEDDHAIAVCGGATKHCAIQKMTVPKDAKYGVRCCSDYHFPMSRIQEGCSCYGGSLGIHKECFMDATYDQAAAFCSDSGARLCTEEELLNKCAKNTGCKLNKKLVWSQPIGSPAVLAPTPAPSTPVPSSSPSSFCGPNESEVYLFLTTDYFPSEISWELLDMSSNTVVESRQEGFYDDQFTDYHERMCVSKDLCYKFTIRDDTGHGVLYDGYYSVSYEGVVVRSSDTSIYTPKAYDHEDHSGTNENHHDHHGHDHDHGHGDHSL